MLTFNLVSYREWSLKTPADLAEAASFSHSNEPETQNLHVKCSLIWNVGSHILTERIEKVGDFFNTAGYHFYILSIRPVLMYLPLHWVFLASHV